MRPKSRQNRRYLPRQTDTEEVSRKIQALGSIETLDVHTGICIYFTIYPFIASYTITSANKGENLPFNSQPHNHICKQDRELTPS